MITTDVGRLTRRGHLARMGMVGAGAAGVLGALAGCAPAGGGAGEAPAASAQPVTIRWPEGTGPLEIEFADEFNKRFNAKYGPKITAVMEPFPDPDWGKRYE